LIFINVPHHASVLKKNKGPIDLHNAKLPTKYLASTFARINYVTLSYDSGTE